MKFLAFLIGLGVFAAPGLAKADFTACNQTDHPLGLAIAHSNGMEWISEGWWTVAPQSCSVILSGALKARYYYLYAVHHDVGGAWAGDRNFCTASRSFTITGRDNCEGRDFKTTGFYEVDTGESLNWEEFLYEEPGTGGASAALPSGGHE